MPIETFPFDAAELLDTPSAMAEFLIACAEESSPEFMARAFEIVARARRRFAETALFIKRDPSE